MRLTYKKQLKSLGNVFRTITDMTGIVTFCIYAYVVNIFIWYQWLSSGKISTLWRFAGFGWSDGPGHRGDNGSAQGHYTCVITLGEMVKLTTFHTILNVFLFKHMHDVFYKGVSAIVTYRNLCHSSTIYVTRASDIWYICYMIQYKYHLTRGNFTKNITWYCITISYQ